MVGSSYVESDPIYYDGAIARFKNNGTLDTDIDADPASHWDHDGKAILELEGDEGFLGLRFLEDGSVHATGYRRGLKTGDFLLAQFTSTGALDTTFGTDGYKTTPFMPVSDSIREFAITDTRYVAAASNSDNDWIVRKYTKAGAVMNSWGNEGIAGVHLPPDVFLVALAVHAEGAVAGVGSLWDTKDGFPIRPVVIRVTKQGLLDADFGEVTVRFPTTLDQRWSGGQDVAIGTDGKIVITGGNAFTEGTFSTIVARFHSGACGIIGTGDADEMFGTPANDRMCGLGGADEIHGFDGNDLLVGGPGNDLLDGGRGTDECLGGSGTDDLERCES